MEYQVILEDFQGPLDLLLHLIKEKEMDLPYTAKVGQEVTNIAIYL